MTVIELIDELSKMPPHSRVATCSLADAYGYDNIIHVLPRKGKTETSLEPEELVVLY